MSEAAANEVKKRGGARKKSDGDNALSLAEARRARISKLTKAVIKKETGQETIAGTISTMPHVSTGSILVDYLIGGSPAKDGKGPKCPGFPRRKITELYGPESSGKTTLALSAVADVQKKGGIAMFIDFEHALDKGYAQTLGVSFEEDKLMFFQPDTMEEGFLMISRGVMFGVDMIVVDSVAAMVPALELEKKPGDNAKIGGIAKPMGENLPKFAGWLTKYPKNPETKETSKDEQGTALVFINQTRALIGGQSNETEGTPGGKALKFFAYVRLRTSRIFSESVERIDPLTGKKKKFAYGNVTKVKCIKSKCDARQGHDVDIFIRYGYGIDNYFSVIQTASAQKIMKKDGSRITYGGHRLQGRDKWRQFLIENQSVYDELALKVVAAVLSNAETAIADEDLSEEDRILAELDDIDDLDEPKDAPVEEVTVEDPEGG